MTTQVRVLNTGPYPVEVEIHTKDVGPQGEESGQRTELITLSPGMVSPEIMLWKGKSVSVKEVGSG